MKFAVINKETDKVVQPYNYYFVIRQDGELWTVNHDLTFTKADDKYEVIHPVHDSAECTESCNKLDGISIFYDPCKDCKIVS